jgi:hypothetical protein
MQCHVAPFRESNWVEGQGFRMKTRQYDADLFLNMLGNFLGQLSKVVPIDIVVFVPSPE